jgi:hypothetical protein
MAIAFYPCCGVDIEQPLMLLKNYVDEVVFCDMEKRLSSHWRQVAADAVNNLPSATFRVGDLTQIANELPIINLLFYRRDSAGEGGSGVFVLGDSVLPLILQRFPSEGGLIITDGSNSRGSNFERMIRSRGLTKHGWTFNRAYEQPLMDDHRLYVIDVRRARPDRPQPARTIAAR